MSKRTVEIWWDVVNNVHRGVDGNVLPKEKYPYIIFLEKPLVKLHLVTDVALTAYTGLTPTSVFTASIDSDFDHSTDLMCKTEDSGINVAGDWTDVNVGQGRLSIRLDADNTGYQTKISTLSEKTNCTFELLEFEAGSGDLVSATQIPYRCYNIVDGAGAVPPSPVGDYYTKAESDARFVGATNFVWYTQSGQQCLRIVNDAGVTLVEFTPPGV